MIKSLSVSQITAFDTASDGGCNRRWWFKNVLKKPEPETKANAIGTQTHAEIEHYLKTGEKTLGKIAMSAAHFIPDPDPRILVEREFSPGELSVRGIPMRGYIDVVNTTDHYIDVDGTREKMGPGTVEVVDWKTTKDLRYAKTPYMLTQTVQMIGYGKWALNTIPDLKYVRLSHVYMRTAGASKSQKVSVRAGAGLIEMGWSRIVGVVDQMIAVADTTDIEKVAPNRNACNSYGGCPHRAYCPMSKDETIKAIFGGSNGPQGDDNMGLLSQLQNSTPPNANRAALLAEIEAEETAAKVDPELSAAVAQIKASAGIMGYPTMSTAVRAAWGSVSPGVPEPAGALLQLKVEDTATLIQLGRELAAKQVVPTDAPPYDETLAADPIPPETLAALPQVVQDAVNNTPQPDIAPATEPTMGPVKRRGRPKKSDAPSDASAPTQVVTQPGTGNVTHVTVTGLTIYRDVTVRGLVTPLEPYIDTLCKALAQKAGAVDIQCAPNDSPLGYGKWKGLLAAAAKAFPPPPGAYVVEVGTNEPRAVVVDALMESCDFYVRGGR